MTDDYIIEKEENDKKRFANLNDNECQLCGGRGADMRNLFIKYMAEMSYYAEEFIWLHGIKHRPEALRAFYYLRTCKTCRGTILESIKEAIDKCRERKKDSVNYDPAGNERTVPVYKQNGITIYMSDPEWRIYHGYENEVD